MRGFAHGHLLAALQVIENINSWGLNLHSIISRATSPLWANPVDVLSCVLQVASQLLEEMFGEVQREPFNKNHLDVTGFTVDAVGSVDDQPHLPLN